MEQHYMYGTGESEGIEGARMDKMSAGSRSKVFFIGLFPVIVVVVFLIVAKLAGFAFWEALTEKVETDPDGYVVVTKVLGSEVSSRAASKTDMVVERGGERLYAWLGVIAALLVAAFGLLFVVAAFMPSSNTFLVWVVKKANAPPTTL